YAKDKGGKGNRYRLLETVKSANKDDAKSIGQIKGLVDAFCQGYKTDLATARGNAFARLATYNQRFDDLTMLEPNWLEEGQLKDTAANDVSVAVSANVLRDFKNHVSQVQPLIDRGLQIALWREVNDMLPGTIAIQDDPYMTSNQKQLLKSYLKSLSN